MSAETTTHPRMSASRVLDGKAIAERIKAELLSEIRGFREPPRLAIISFDTPTSQLYLTVQLNQARALGIVTDVEFRFPWNVTQRRVEQAVAGLNQGQMHGIFVHQPMPPQINAQRVSALIDPRKDVEGIHPQNMARRFFAKARSGSCTALAVMELIESTNVSLEGKEAVVIGHSEIVGRPVSMLLLDKLATTTICHLGTDKAGRLEEHVRRADILVVAVGRPQFILEFFPRNQAHCHRHAIDSGDQQSARRIVGGAAPVHSACVSRIDECPLCRRRREDSFITQLCELLPARCAIFRSRAPHVIYG